MKKIVKLFGRIVVRESGKIFLTQFFEYFVHRKKYFGTLSRFNFFHVFSTALSPMKITKLSVKNNPIFRKVDFKKYFFIYSAKDRSLITRIN